MAVGLSPDTIANVGPVVANTMNLSWSDDRLKVVEWINDYRNLLYTLYDDFKLFDNIFHCICVTEFPQVCSTCCHPTYRGVTLPSDVLAPEAVYAYGSPLTIRSKWRESHTGTGGCGSRHDLILMPEQFATERELTSVTKIKIFTEHEDDDGKHAYVEAIDSGGKNVKICFKLVGNGFAVSPKKIKKILSVSLPSERKGSLILSQADNYDLSIYDPWETVPLYQRLKLPDHCTDYAVLIQGTKRFRKIYFDHDIVEVGDVLVIKAAAKYFKFGEAGGDAKEIASSEYHLSNMRRFLTGLMSRHRGSATQDGSPFKGRPITKTTRLPGYCR